MHSLGNLCAVLVRCFLLKDGARQEEEQGEALSDVPMPAQARWLELVHTKLP